MFVTFFLCRKIRPMHRLLTYFGITPQKWSLLLNLEIFFKKKVIVNRIVPIIIISLIRFLVQLKTVVRHLNSSCIRIRIWFVFAQHFYLKLVYIIYSIDEDVFASFRGILRCVHFLLQMMRTMWTPTVA